MTFAEEIYEIVKQIPKGKITSYGAIAKALGKPKAARQVGWVLNQSMGNPEIPAHRVLNRNGLLTGRMHFQTPQTMQERLEAEGLHVQKNQVTNFHESFWDPAEEL